MTYICPDCGSRALDAGFGHGPFVKNISTGEVRPPWQELHLSCANGHTWADKLTAGGERTTRSTGEVGSKH